MDWKVLFFETSSGKSPVDEFVKDQQSQTRSKALRLFEILEEYGNMLGMPWSKSIGSGLYELRVRGKEELRILYCFKRTNIYLLHAFKKQTNRIPRKEFELALTRSKSLT